MRSIYEKTKLANNRDWPRWNENLRDYIAALRINDILSENYEIPPSEDPEKQWYEAQDTILQSFLRITTDSKHLYLLKGLPTAQQQYQTLKVHLDLGTHTQIYFSARDLITMKFIIYENILASFTSYIN
jgi:hypothetical protein